LILKVELTFTEEAQNVLFKDPVGTGPVLVGPCQHSMVRPQVADRGTASDKDGSCE